MLTIDITECADLGLLGDGLGKHTITARAENAKSNPLRIAGIEYGNIVKNE